MKIPLSLRPGGLFYKYRVLPALVWFAITSVLLFTPGDDLPDVGDWFGEFNVDKIIHGCIFSVMSFLFMCCYGLSNLPSAEKKQYFTRICLATCVWGAASELIQGFFIRNRGMSVVDGLADVGGAIVALLLASYLFTPAATRGNSNTTP